MSQLLRRTNPLNFIFKKHKNTMAANSVVLILGAGPRVGASVAEHFLNNGYKVAVASRSGKAADTTSELSGFKADFADPNSIAPLFDAVKTQLGAPPSIVVYNAAGMSPPPEKDSVLSIPAESVAKDLNINTISPYVAAQQAISGWETLPQGTKKAFIYTGNALNVTILPMPAMLTLGVGKSASAHWLGLADTLYSARGYRQVCTKRIDYPNFLTSN